MCTAASVVCTSHIVYSHHLSQVATAPFLIFEINCNNNKHLSIITNTSETPPQVAGALKVIMRCNANSLSQAHSNHTTSGFIDPS